MEKERDISALLVAPSKTIIVKALEAFGKEEENYTRRLKGLMTFKNNIFRYQFGPHGICFLTSRQKFFQFVMFQENSTSLPTINFDTVINTSQLNDFVEEADKRSNGLFRKASRLISFWNYDTKKQRNLTSKYFKTVQLLMLTLSWFYSQKKHPSALSKFILDALSYVLENTKENISFEFKGEKLCSSPLLNFSSAKQALRQKIQAIKANNQIPESELEQLSDALKVDENDARINTLIEWISEKLGDLAKKVTLMGSTSRGTAVKGHSDLDILLILKDQIKWESSQEIESTVNKVFQLLSEGAKVRLQAHSFFVDTNVASCDLVIAKVYHDKINPGIKLFEVGYKQEPNCLIVKKADEILHV